MIFSLPEMVALALLNHFSEQATTVQLYMYFYGMILQTAEGFLSRLLFNMKEMSLN